MISFGGDLSFRQDRGLAGQTPQQQGRVVAAYLSADLVVLIMRPGLRLRSFAMPFAPCLAA